MPINDTTFETVNIWFHPHVDVDSMAELFLQAIRGSGGSRRRASLYRIKGDTAIFHVEVGGKNDTIEPLLERWCVDNENSVVEIW